VELSRVVVLGSSPVEGDTVNKLIDNQTLLLKNTPGWPGPFTSEVARTRRLPTARVVLGRRAAYSSRSVSSRIGWIFEVHGLLIDSARVLDALSSPSSVSSR
jgi:hypothetical protein